MGNREHIYEIIAGNIRKERKRFGMTQAELAERADISLDTIKSVENGRRAMSLDTYLNIVHALESSPMVLMSRKHPQKHIERFAFMMNRRDEREIEFSIVVLGTPKEWNVSRRNFTPTFFFSFLWAAAALW